MQCLADTREEHMKPTETGKSEKRESALGRVSEQLARLENRDWELWCITVITGIVISTGFLAYTFPAAVLREGNIHVEFTASKELFIGLSALLILINTYVVSRHIALRRLQSKLISETIHSEVIRLNSFIDPLTEIYNRRSLDEMASQFISAARRQNEPLTFLLVDVDGFKQVNTRFGHLTGDFVLAEMATLLKRSTRDSDAVIRYGGDEFLILLANSSTNGAQTLIDRVEASLRDWNRGGHLRGLKLSFSIGIAEWSDGQTLDEMLDTADRDMYVVKNSKARGR
jgi:diguanylate cyclase (GGDEF)-like protein